MFRFTSGLILNGISLICFFKDYKIASILFLCAGVAFWGLLEVASELADCVDCFD